MLNRKDLRLHAKTGKVTFTLMVGCSRQKSSFYDNICNDKVGNP